MRRVTVAKECNVIDICEQKNKTSLSKKSRLRHYQLIKIIVFPQLKISNNVEFSVLFTVHRDISVQ